MEISITNKKSQDSIQTEESVHSSALAPIQDKAALLIAQGCSGVEVAKKVGRTPETISRWKNDDYHFQAKINEYRQGMIQAGRDTLRGLIDPATQAIADVLNGGSNTEKLKAADLVIKNLDIFSKQAILMCGESTVEGIIKENDPLFGILGDTSTVSKMFDYPNPFEKHQKAKQIKSQYTLGDCNPENKNFSQETLEMRLAVLRRSEKEGITPSKPVKDMNEKELLKFLDTVSSHVFD